MNPIRVVCGIIWDKGRYLIAQRSETMKQPLYWEFPGGKVMDGESDESAIIRELYEELQITVIPKKKLDSYLFTGYGFQLIMVPIFCIIGEGTPIPVEHKEVIFVKPAQISGYVFAPADLPIVELLINESENQNTFFRESL